MCCDLKWLCYCFYLQVFYAIYMKSFVDIYKLDLTAIEGKLMVDHLKFIRENIEGFFQKFLNICRTVMKNYNE